MLAHPTDPVARVACETIQLQLARAGIPIKLVEFTADELLAGKVDYDLRYAELAVWEPVADARALVGPGGLAGDVGSPYLAAALRQLDDATNWKDVRAKLSEIHDIAHHDLPLIPLWQTVNYFAYRTDVRGIGDSPITLYQNVDQWRIGGGDDDNSVAELQDRPVGTAHRGAALTSTLTPCSARWRSPRRVGRSSAARPSSRTCGRASPIGFTRPWRSMRRATWRQQLAAELPAYLQDRVNTSIGIVWRLKTEWRPGRCVTGCSAASRPFTAEDDRRRAAR